MTTSSHELIEYDQNFPVRLFFHRLGHTPRHWHDCIELLLILSGSVTVRVENEISHLSEGDLILINYNQIHETYSEDGTLLSLQLRLSIFHQDWLAPNYLAFVCDSSRDTNKERYTPLKQYLALLVNNNRSHDKENILLNYSYCYRLMDELVKNFSVPADQIQQRSPQKIQKIGEILHYIESHYTEKITLASAAQAVYLSPSYLSHFFEESMDVPFFVYLTNYRLERSIKDLQLSNRSLTDIAESCGFASTRAYSTFFRKKYGVLPAQFRKSSGEAISTDNAAPISESSYLELKKDLCLNAMTAYLPGTSMPAASGTADTLLRVQSLPPISTAAPAKRLRHTFRSFCSIGRAYDILYADNDALLARVQREIGFHYIKFHGIFDDALHVYREDENGTPLYNFYYTDKILHRLLALGLKPMIQLSFMPQALALRPQDTCCTVRFVISEPKDNEKWCALVRTFTEHCIEVFGRIEVESWIFTFWNEALANQAFCFTNDNNFLELYKLTYRTVKAVDPQIYYAATSFTSSYFPTHRYERYLQYIRRHHCVPDCFLFHYYGTDEEFEHSHEKSDRDFIRDSGTSLPLTLSTDPDQMDKYLSSIETTLRPDFPQPIYLTEWGFSPSHREWLNDTVFSACYIVRNILQNYDRVESFCHWNLTDQIDELEQPDTTFHGGTGLFTRSGLPKPAYYAYCLLHHLQDYLLFRQEGIFVTANTEHTKFAVILYNYCHFSDLYAKGVLFDVNEQNRYAAFSRLERRRVRFTLTALPDCPYLMQETFLHRGSGSVYDAWQESGGLEPLTDADSVRLAAQSVPHAKKTADSIQNHTLSYEATLSPLEVRLIELTLKQE